MREFEDKYFIMDPKIHELLPDGTYLRDGMLVLTEDDKKRTSLSERLKTTPPELSQYFLDEIQQSPLETSKLLMANRWCKVANVKKIEYPSHHEIHFVGVYWDGSKRKWVANINAAWYALKESIPAEMLGEDGAILMPLPEEKTETEEDKSWWRVCRLFEVHVQDSRTPEYTTRCLLREFDRVGDGIYPSLLSLVKTYDEHPGTSEREAIKQYARETFRIFVEDMDANPFNYGPEVKWIAWFVYQDINKYMEQP